MIGLRSGLKVGPRVGPAVGLAADEISAGVSVTRDGPTNVFVPQTSLDFTALGIATPQSIWLCQESSGNLADVNAVTTLTATGAFSYQVNVTGWTRKAVELDQNNERFGAALAAGPNPGTGSVAWLAYIQFVSVAAANGRLILAGSHNGAAGVRCTFGTTGLITCHCVGVDTAGSSNHADSVVHPVLLQYNRTGTTVRVITNLETITGTFNTGVVDSTKGIGSNGGAAAPMRVVWAAAWVGANAESLSASTLTALGW